MNDIEGMKLIKVVQSAYPRQEFSESTVAVYVRMLSDIPYDIAQKAVYKLIAESVFIPTVAEIRKAAVEIACPAPHVEDAVIEVRNAIRSYSPYNEWRHEWTSPVVRDAVAAMGGLSHMGGNEQPEYMWREFRRVYESIREREQSRLQTVQGAIAQVAVPFLPVSEVPA